MVSGKITLVYPPYTNQAVHLVPPIGILRLAAYLKEHGRPVEIVDLLLELAEGSFPLTEQLPDACAERLLATGADYFGFSVQALTISTSISIAQRLKSKNRHVKIIFGGYGISFETKKFLELAEAVDAAVVGEGEQTLHELLCAYDGKLQLRHIAGIAFRERREFPVVQTGARSLIENLDELPLPAYDLAPDLRRYIKSSAEKASYNQPFPIDAGRGCSFTCTFCSSCLMFARKVRVRSPENIIAELRLVHDKWGVSQFLMTYDLFDFDKDYVRDFCQKIIAARLPIKWECRCRIEMLDPETVALMHKAGCEHVLFGIESGSKRTLKAIKKTTNLSRMRERIEIVVKGGLKPIFSFVVGFPEETPADVDETLKLGLFCRLVGQSYVSLHMPTPLPGTELWMQTKGMLVLSNMTGDMASGVGFSAGKDLLQEDLQRIKKHPDLFSTFYNIDPPYLGIDRVFFLHRVWNKLVAYYPVSLYHLSDLGVSIWETVDSFKEWLPADRLDRLLDYSAPVNLSHMASDFGSFLLAYAHNSPVADNLLHSLIEGERARALAWAGADTSARRKSSSAKEVKYAWASEAKVVFLRHDIEAAAVLDAQVEERPHVRVFIPRGIGDYSEVEVPIEVVDFVDSAQSDAELSSELQECLTELCILGVLIDNEASRDVRASMANRSHMEDHPDYARSPC